MPQLHQILALSTSTRQAATSEISALHNTTRKAASMNGLERKFEPTVDGGETFPTESNRVLYRADEVLAELRALLEKVINIEDCKASANQLAKADVVVDGQVLLPKVPVTSLLNLESDLKNLHTFVAKMVTLDPSEVWAEDPTTGLMRSETNKTSRTKKVQKAIVLYDATEHHPAQTQLVSEDQLIGYWSTTKYSGAISAVEKKKILAKVTKLHEAVVSARQMANLQEVEPSTLGQKVMGFIFG